MRARPIETALAIHSAARYKVSRAGHRGPLRRTLRNATPESLPLGCSSSRRQPCAAPRWAGARAAGEATRDVAAPPQRDMKPLQRVRVVLRRNLSALLRLEVGPQRDLEVVTHVDARLDAWIEPSNRAVRLLREASG